MIGRRLDLAYLMGCLIPFKSEPASCGSKSRAIGMPSCDCILKNSDDFVGILTSCSSDHGGRSR
jgi:hypothetical protein